MSHSFNIGNLETFYCTFLTLENKEPTTVVNPKITIRHIDDTFTVVTDINEADMVLLDETTYYFKWNIPIDAFIGTYNVECQATADGEYAETNETILVRS